MNIFTKKIKSDKIIMKLKKDEHYTMVIIITHRMQELEDIEYETIDILK